MKRYLLPVLLFLVVGSAVGQAERPNVLIILADDLGWKDVGYNGSLIDTPNIDNLASQGVRLTRYYAQPSCSPTRASLMTGQSVLRTGVLLPIDKNNLHSLPLDRKILPQYFKEAGYQTSLIGKWHLGHAYRNQLPTSRGFDHAYGHLLGGVGHWSHIHGGGLDWQRDGEALREEGYTTHLLTAETIRQIEERDPSRPFFIYLALAAPHLPNEAPEATVARYATVADGNRRVHAAMVDEIDQGVGRILVTLERENLLDNTLIWFMSDNGGLLPGSGIPVLDTVIGKLTDWFGKPLPLESLEFVRSNIQDGGSDNGPYRRGKGSIYEGGVLVPSAVYWRGQLGAMDVTQRVTAQDVLPTLAAAAQLALPDDIVLDGGDRWATLQGKPAVEAVDYATTGIDGKAYYRGDWKLVVPSSGESQLFNLASDPIEATDLAASHRAMVAEMQAALASIPRGESIHQTPWYDILLDPDKFGGEEDRQPWVERVRD